MMNSSDLLTVYGDMAKSALRTLTRAGRYLQEQAGQRFWYDVKLREPANLCFKLASDIRKENGIIPPD